MVESRLFYRSISGKEVKMSQFMNVGQRCVDECVEVSGFYPQYFVWTLMNRSEAHVKLLEGDADVRGDFYKQNSKERIEFLRSDLAKEFSNLLDHGSFPGSNNEQNLELAQCMHYTFKNMWNEYSEDDFLEFFQTVDEISGDIV